MSEKEYLRQREISDKRVEEAMHEIKEASKRFDQKVKEILQHC
jgi:hypothetical protein